MIIMMMNIMMMNIMIKMKKVVIMMINEDLNVEYTILMIITLNMMMLMMITKVERKREQMVSEA